MQGEVSASRARHNTGSSFNDTNFFATFAPLR
jgi:hypothetical protein